MDVVGITKKQMQDHLKGVVEEITFDDIPIGGTFLYLPAGCREDYLATVWVKLDNSCEDNCLALAGFDLDALIGCAYGPSKYYYIKPEGEV